MSLCHRSPSFNQCYTGPILLPVPVPVPVLQLTNLVLLVWVLELNQFLGGSGFC